MDEVVYFCQGLTQKDFDDLSRAGVKKTKIMELIGLSGKEVYRELQEIIERLITNPEFDKRNWVLMVLINLQGACRDNSESWFDITEKPTGEITPIFPPAAIPRYMVLPVAKK